VSKSKSKVSTPVAKYGSVSEEEKGCLGRADRCSSAVRAVESVTKFEGELGLGRHVEVEVLESSVL
jgi:hypothetical protein